MVSKGSNDMEMSRRRFIKTVGLVAGGVATFPLQAHARKLFSGNPAITVGVLSPRSTMVHRMGENFVAGMKLQFAEAGWTRVNLVTVDIGRSPGVALAKAQELLAGQNVDILAGFLNPIMQPRLLEFLKADGTPFINVDGGANIPTAAEEHLLISHNSWGYWQANLAMGRWAADNMGKRAFIASSSYESGYDSTHGFRAGFEAAGGEIVQGSAIHTADGKDELEALMAVIGKCNPDLVYAMYSGRGAVEFVKAYAQAGLAGVVPLAASPFMVDEALLPAMGKAALGIKSCLSWAPGLKTPENIAFRGAFAHATGSTPDLFAVLGYETGKIMTATVTGSGKSLPRELRTARFAGPRGEFAMNGKSGYADTPLYLREVRPDVTGLGNVVLERLSNLAGWQKLQDRSCGSARCGWSNAYLCV
jgi:branched-chain amino acid transport system substrate-binding protein